MTEKPNIQIWDVDRIIPYAQNAKKHEKDQVSKIAESIKTFGWTQPIVVDKHGVIIAGHGRRLAAISLELTEVPVWIRDDLDEQEVKALRLVDNRVAESKIDTEMFKMELASLDFNLEGMFDAKELEFAGADLGEIDLSAFVDDVAAAAQQQETKSQQNLEIIKGKSIPIARVLGIKEIKAVNQFAISRLIAEIERRTALKGEDALVAFSSTLIANGVSND